MAERRDGLQRAINAYKFERAQAVSSQLADLLDVRLPDLPSTVIVTAVPTVPAHIRQRGYDHAELIAKRFARRRKLPYQRTLRRAHHTSQRGANRAQRLSQMNDAFTMSGSLEGAATYLLIDDVVTTGSTLRAAAGTLRQAGAGEVWAAAVAHQPLD